MPGTDRCQTYAAFVGASLVSGKARGWVTVPLSLRLAGLEPQSPKPDLRTRGLLALRHVTFGQQAALSYLC